LRDIKGISRLGNASKSANAGKIFDLPEAHRGPPAFLFVLPQPMVNFGLPWRWACYHRSSDPDLVLHSPSGVSFEVKIAYIRALDKDFLPQAALAVAQTAGSGRIRPRSRCFLAQGRRFSAQRTDLSSRFRSV
ncbi:hypothetical protein, partial [Hyphomonas atlantica]|uniref:hypothetical protein n=1 Tax=Hyphomonas atlantica TaxID=1280948 RepID=UPI0035157502